MNRLSKILIIPLLIVMVFAFGMGAFAEIHSKWVAGDLIFFDGTTNIFSIRDDTDGVKIYDDLNLTFGTGNDATIKYDEDSTDKLLITCSNGFTISGAITLDSTFAVTLTDPTTASNAVYGLINAGQPWATSGNLVGLRGKVVITAAGNTGDATGVWAGLEITSASVQRFGLQVGLNVEAYSNTICLPNAVLYIQSLPSGSTTDYSDVPYLVFSETIAGGATGSNILFEVGHSWANTVPTIGSGELFYNHTLQIAVNENAGVRTNFFIPLSTVTGTYTTEYLIDVTVAGGTAIDIGTSVTGINFSGTYSTAAIAIGTVGKITFRDAQINMYAADDGDLVINADATLIITSPATKIVAQTSLIHEYDAGDYVTQTVADGGAVKVAVTGASSGTYEIETDGGEILLDAANNITLDAGTGDIDCSDDILMATTSKVQFHDSGMYINASNDAVMVISSDGTLGVSATTSYTVTSTAVKFIAQTSVVHEYDAASYVTQTISDAGLVTVTVTGDSAGSYEIVADDTTIVLDANTAVSLEAGAGTYGFSATTLDMNSLTITECGKITANDAAGPAFIDEAVTSTNPTLCPNKTDETLGVGWASNVLHLVVGGASELSVSATAVTLPTNELIITAGNFTVTGSITQKFDADDYVTTTVVATGTVKVTTTGNAAGSYEIETDDGAITLDANTTIALEAGAGTFDFSATTLAMNALTITECGDIDANDAAGPSFLNEAATATNPTLCPNKAEDDTGIGWQSDVLHFVLGTADEYSFSTSAVDFNSNNLGEVGTYSGTGAITISPTAAGTFLDFVLETEWVSGTLINIDSAAAGVTIGADMLGMVLDFNANFTAAADHDVTGFKLLLPALTSSSNVTTTYIGFDLNIAGNLNQSAAGDIVWKGINVQMPTTAETTGNTIAHGIFITSGTITSGVQNAVTISGTFTDGLNFSAATCATADIVLQYSATITNTSTDLLTITEPTITLTASTAVNLDGPITTTKSMTISPVATGTFIDFVLEDEWTTGTLINADFASATTLTGAAVGIALDFTNVDAGSDQDIKCIDLTFPDLTFDTVSKTLKGIEISGDTITQTTSGTSVWTGIDITIPTLVETAGTLTGTGIKITGGTCTTDPISYGIYLAGTFETAGIILGGTYTESAIEIGGTYDHGIRFTEDMVGGDVTNSFINVGDYTTGIAVAPTTANMFGVMHNVTLNVDVAYWYQAYYTKITTSGTTTSTSIAGHAMRINVATSLEAVYGIQCHTNITAGADVTQEIASISTMVDMGTGDTTTDRVVALQALITGSGTAGTVTGLLHVAYFGNRGTVIDTDAIVFIHNQSAATTDVAVEFDLDGTVTNVWEFNGTVSDAWTITDAGAGAAISAENEYFLIPVTVEGSAVQFYILAAETWN